MPWDRHVRVRHWKAVSHTPDFLFLDPSKRKALVLVDTCVPQRTRSLIKQWLSEFALDGLNTRFAVEVVTDAEQGVGNLLKAADTATRMAVRQAPRQAHEVVGLGERSVRYVIETLAVLKADFKQSFGVEVRDDYLALEVMHQYVCTTRKRVWRPWRTDRGAHGSVVIGKKLPHW